jgi:hypothetical protein
VWPVRAPAWQGKEGKKEEGREEGKEKKKKQKISGCTMGLSNQNLAFPESPRWVP